MFRSHRSASARQLWRHRCSTVSRDHRDGPPHNPEDPQHALRPAAQQLFKKLTDEQLWRLAEAVQSKGRCDRGCVWTPPDPRSPNHGLAPGALLCKIYRWPDLRGPAHLKRLAHCQGKEGNATCCNPYHLSRLTPPDPACKVRDVLPLHSITNQETRVQDSALSRASIKDGAWCALAYWEQRSRVGRLYHVTEPSIHIFHDLPKGSGLCLAFLAFHTHSEAVKRARRKIGAGVILSREQGDVWLYNRSEHPVFINSPTLAPVIGRGQSVHKLAPGYCIKVFDAQRGERLSRCSAQGEGPCDPHSVRISFAKGWGASYSRQFITSCPCWLEILLSKPK